MGRRFTVAGENLTLGTGSVLLALRTAASLSAGSILAMLRIEIFQNATATGAQVRGETATRDTAGTLTLTSVTPSNVSYAGPASGLSGNVAPVGAAARIGINSSADSGGTYTQRRPFNFNNLNGYLWIPTPDERMIISPDNTFILRFTAAPGTTTGWGFAVEYEELV